MKHRQLSAIFHGAAIVLALAGAGLAFATGASLNGALAIGVVALLVAPYAWALLPRPRSNAVLMGKVAQQVEHGRKLVIYERDTGLYAQWYVTLRGDEECIRAQRYGHPLSILVIEPRTDTNSAPLSGALATWLATRTRATDIVGYLGNGRHVVIMPETAPDKASVFNARMLADAPPARLALAEYPADGATFEELYAAAATRLLREARSAA